MVKVGDMVEVDQLLIILEFDKVSMEIFLLVFGVVESVLIKVGDEVGIGDLIFKLKVEGVVLVVEE